tara:strand:- start:40 stop:522 length:483 start_codon:yes stop_codon:yes gene_type:complete
MIVSRGTGLGAVKLSVPYRKGAPVYTAFKVAEIMNVMSNSRLDVGKIKETLNNESKYWTESNVSINDLKNVGKGVNPKEARIEKGRIIAMSDGTIVDGRHRAAMLKSMDRKKIGAYVPLIRSSNLSGIDLPDIYRRTRSSKLIQYSLIALGVALVIRKVF